MSNDLKINFQDYAKEVLYFLISKIPVIGDIYGIHQNVKSNLKNNILESKINEISLALRNSPAKSLIKIDSREFELIRNRRDIIGMISNPKENPLATSNQFLENINILNPSDNFFTEIRMKNLTNNSYVSKKRHGISLIFIDNLTGQFIPNFFHLILHEGQGFFTYTTSFTKELGWARVPVYNVNSFKIGRRNGMTECYINNTSIFKEILSMNNSFRLGFFVEKNNVINYNVVFTREVGKF